MEGKREKPEPASPIEVARTLLARAREEAVPRLHDASKETVRASARNAPTRAQTDSGVRPSRRAVTLPAPNRSDRIDTDAGVDDRYVLLGELGRGGMGRVDEVFDRVLGRPVAQKGLLSDADEDRAAMLVGEAQTCAQLEHPSIVPVYDLDAAEDGQPFYTMRVVRGRTLRDVLEDNLDSERPQTPLAQILGVFRQVCLAVDYAHSRGVVHRDLKPDNVIVGEFGEVYVVDWGIAHLVEGSSVKRAEVIPVVAGTPAYMAPEQVLGDVVDGRTDVFALGVILYEILAGSRPFGSENLRSVHERRTQTVDSPPSARDPRRSVTTAFDDLVLACLSPTPQGRPGRARVIANTIDEFLDRERDRAEREREAQTYADEGRAAWQRALALDARGRDLAAKTRALISELPSWISAEEKQKLWEFEAQAHQLRSESAKSRAQAETAFARALGRVAEHGPARKGLCAIYFEQFVAAERNGDHQLMTQYLDLARAYDDGELALELANEGELCVTPVPDEAKLELARYERKGPLLVSHPLGALEPEQALSSILPAGSYLLEVQVNDVRIRYPFVIERAKKHTLRLRLAQREEIPDDMVLIPGGPFLHFTGLGLPGEPRMLGDFAIGRFPVRVADYVRFLGDLSSEEREKHMPATVKGEPYLIRDGEVWRLGPRVVEGEARKAMTRERELDLPISEISWFSAMAYAEWVASKTGRPYRLPTALEWEKAARGADGRPYPMGVRFDPSLAKTRESRRETAQPEPVGAFPSDTSPYGVRDLAGGFGDWTLSSPDGAVVGPRGESDTPTAAYKRQVLWCGGTWSSTRPAPEMRYPQSIDSWGGWISFRLVLPLDEHGSSELATEPMRRD